MDIMEIPLIQLKTGQRAKILRLEGGPGFQRNVRSRGIREGKALEVVTKHPIGGPIVIEIDGRETAIGRGMAMRIIVEVEQW
jgi:ferrous iron transport protein A